MHRAPHRYRDPLSERDIARLAATTAATTLGSIIGCAVGFSTADAYLASGTLLGAAVGGAIGIAMTEEGRALYRSGLARVERQAYTLSTSLRTPR